MLKSLFVFFCCFAIIKITNAQNLLENGGFETHANLDCINCPMFGYKFSSVIPPWKNLNGGYSFICDCKYKKEAAAAKNGICNLDKVSPYRGCNMIELDYMPSCLDQEHKTRGCSAYLATKLAQPLEIGKVYEISFWLYILPSSAPDADYARFIGINLYPDAIRNPTGKLLESSDFQIDTVIIGRWYPVKWLIRPVCRLQFLVLGVFRGDGDDPPVNTDGNDNRFYIDEVEIKSVTQKVDTSLTIVPYCRFSKKEKEDTPDEVEGASCFFSSGDSSLSTSAKILLDSFAARAKANPGTAFFITGRTDSIGSNHKALSQARIKSVLDYLEATHTIPRFRFLSISLGTDHPIAGNKTVQERQQNRSVQIQQLDCPMHLMVYRHVLQHVFAGEHLPAFKLLNVWLHLAPDRQKILVLFDPRLDPLKSDQKWNRQVVKKIREVYNNQMQPALAYALDSLGLEDQKCRTLDRYLENMQAYVADQDSSDRRWDVHFDCDTSVLYAIEDEAHVQALVKLIGNEWPKISSVGQRPTKTAFLVISHTSDTSLIARYLPLLKQRCEAGEAEWIHYATLSDRMLVHRGLPQHFGTQFKIPESTTEKPRLFPLENAALVNAWRKELGLEPITDLE